MILNFDVRLNHSVVFLGKFVILTIHFLVSETNYVTDLRAAVMKYYHDKG